MMMFFNEYSISNGYSQFGVDTYLGNHSLLGTNFLPCIRIVSLFSVTPTSERGRSKLLSLFELQLFFAILLYSLFIPNASFIAMLMSLLLLNFLFVPATDNINPSLVFLVCVCWRRASSDFTFVNFPLLPDNIFLYLIPTTLT